MINPADSLVSFLDNWYLLHRQVSASGAYQLRRTVSLYDEFLTRHSKVRDLVDDTYSRFIVWLETNEYAARTICGHAGNLLCLWRLAYEENALPSLPRRVRKPKRPQPQPNAWTSDEFARVLVACKGLPGFLGNGVPRSIYFPCLYSVAYDTGLRRGDLWTLDKSDITSGGTIWLTIHKTGVPHVCGLSVEAVRMLTMLPGAKPLAWPHAVQTFYDWANRVADRAGVPRGSLKMCRKTGATQIYRSDPQKAKQYLGHQSPEMWRHYVDLGQTQQPVMPVRMAKSMRTSVRVIRRA